MALAFWNEGAPRKIKGTTVRVAGSVIMGASADPDIDLYNYAVAGPKAQSATQRQLPSTFENDGWTITETRHVESQDIERLRLHVSSQVKNKLDGVINAGIEWNGYIVQTDNDSQSKVTGAIVGLDKSGLTSQIWRMLDNTIVNLSDVEFNEMALAVRDHVNNCYISQGAYEAAIAAENDGETLLSMDLDIGWPAHYSPEFEV